MIKIIAVDDDTRFLDSIAKLIDSLPERYQLVGQYSAVEDDEGVEELLDTIVYQKPDVILMDFNFSKIGRPSDYGIELIRHIANRIPNQKIIMLTNDDALSNDAVLTKVEQSFRAGAMAYLEKGEPEKWLECIKEVAIGQLIKHAVSEAIIQMWVERLKAPLLFPLTNREIEAIGLISEDKRVEDVALAMGIKRDGVHFHLNNAKIKLGIKTLHGLVAKALRAGIITS